MKTLLVGKKASGKSSFLYKLFSDNDTVGGVVCIPVFENDVSIGKNAVNLISKQQHIYCRNKTVASFDGIVTDNYVIHQDGLSFCQKAVLDSLDKSLVIIDEGGPLELSGGGLHDQIKTVLMRDKETIIAVREGIEQDFIEKFPYNFTKFYFTERYHNGYS